MVLTTAEASRIIMVLTSGRLLARHRVLTELMDAGVFPGSRCDSDYSGSLVHLSKMAALLRGF